MFTDSHVHILDYFDNLTDEEKKIFTLEADIAFCASADTKPRFEKQKKLCESYAQNKEYFFSFGIHPQCPILDFAPFLEKLLKNKQLSAVGECGFDLFDEKNKASLNEQKEVWHLQLELAEKYRMPVVLHCRKALDLIFADTKILKKLPAVVFHGWSGGGGEAISFLKKGVNAYFCIGKGLLRGQKAQKELAAHFELSRILTESDAPYMTLKNEIFSSPKDVKTVAEEIALLRGIQNGNQFNEFLTVIHKNFKTVFGSVKK